MPSQLPYDPTPTDADDFGVGDLGSGPSGKGIDRAFLDAKPGITLGPASDLPEGTPSHPIPGRDRRGDSELPTGNSNEETTVYPYDNSRGTLETVVDTTTEWIFPGEARPRGSVSSCIRHLSSLLKGKSNA